MAIYKSDEKTKDGRSWYFTCYKKNYKGNNTKYKSKKYLTKKDAQNAEALFLTKRDNKTIINFDLASQDYFKQLMEIRKEATVYTYINAYNNNIKPYFYNYNINDITVLQINDWKEKLIKKKYSVKYLNKIYNIIKGIFDYSIKNYGLTINNVTLSGRFQEKNEMVISDSSKIRYITKEEFDKFIYCVDDEMWKTFFILLFYTGMRKGEVQALTWKDIDFIEKEITVNKSLTVKVSNSEMYKITNTKTGVNRKIKINKTLYDQLINYKNIATKYTDFNNNWFVFGNTRYLPQTSIDRFKHKYFELSGVKEITIHEFRHSHVSLLINEYIKSGQTDTAKFFLMMSARMGHSIGVMQKTYMHLFPTIQDEIINILDNI